MAFLNMYVDLKNVPGQGFVSQATDSVNTPAQVEPPLAGTGESHSRFRVRVPFPQVTLHSAYSLQFDHPPSIATLLIVHVLLLI